jgi:hypothetical protein
MLLCLGSARSELPLEMFNAGHLRCFLLAVALQRVLAWADKNKYTHSACPYKLLCLLRKTNEWQMSPNLMTKLIIRPYTMETRPISLSEWKNFTISNDRDCHGLSAYLQLQQDSNMAAEFLLEIRRIRATT